MNFTLICDLLVRAAGKRSLLADTLVEHDGREYCKRLCIMGFVSWGQRGGGCRLKAINSSVHVN